MKKRHIRIASLVLAFCLCLTMLPAISMPIEAASTGLSLYQLRQKFPHGKYWNGGNANSYTSSPCNHHGGCSYDGSCGCNSFLGLSIQCMGYAEKLGYDATGYNPRNNANGWYTYTSSSALDNIKPGDIVRYKNGNHSIYVIGVNGDTVTYTDCNNDGHCIIRWDATISKSTLRSTFTHVRSAPSSVLPGPTHTVDTSYGTNFTAYPKAEITAANIFDAYHNQKDSTSCIWTSDKCTIHEVYTDGCCKVTYPLDAGGTKTVYSKISLFNTPTHNYTGSRYYEGEHPHAITQRCVDYATCGGWIYTGEYYEVKTCEQCWHATFKFGASSISVNVGESKAVSLTISGCLPDSAKMTDRFSPDNDVVEVTAQTQQLTFTGLKVGKTDYTLTIYSDSSKSRVLATITIPVAVTCSNHSYSYKVTTSPTTSATGKLTGTCSKCSTTTTVSLPKLSTTNYTYKVTKAATCTATGTGRYTWKTTTYGSFYFDVSTAKLGHSYTTKITKPTCTAQGYTTHTCSRCSDSYKDNYTNATGHSYSYKVTKAPTSSATGTLTGTCSKCSGTTSISLPKLSTTYYTYKVTKAATCTATGTGRYTWKTTTYGSFYFDVTIAKLGHSYTTKITAPTCTAQGYTTHTCSRCSDNYKDTYTNATGHSYSYKVTKAPTSSVIGTLTGTCSKCNGTTTVSLPKLSATNYTYKVAKAATCTATGTGRYTWKNTTYGSFYFDVSIAAKGHSYSTKVTAPTCTAQGYTTHTCAACGNSYKDTYTDVTAHNYSDGMISKQPTCKDIGVIIYSCNDCGNTKSETIAKLTTHTYDHDCDMNCNVCGATRTVSHQYETSWKKDKMNHWHECSVCADKMDVAPHIPGAEATETTSQNCTVCGYIIQAAIGHTHEYTSEWVTDNNSHWHACVGCEETNSYAAHEFANACDSDCSVCGYTRNASHNYGDAYKSDDINHWHECSDCGEKKDVTAHAPGAAATSTTAQTCTVCGRELAPATGTAHEPELSTDATDVLNTTEPIGEPNDANENDFPWWVIIVTACVGTAIVVLVVFKKKKEH